MYLKSLSLVNFKNISGAELELSPQVNCFTGNNGAGKTNLLDAIHYLSICKSYFNPIDSQNIKHEEPFFVIQGKFDLKGEEENIYCGLKKGQKKSFKRNKKEYDRLADHIGLIPVVMISPADSDLIASGSESRRKLVDSIISQFNKPYLDDLMRYNKVISQRNALLKKFAESRSFNADTLEVWDRQMISLGSKIYDKRKEFIEQFIPTFREHYKNISGGHEVVDIEYKSHLNNDESFESQLKNAQPKDRKVQYSTVGTHKDDLIFKIGEHPIKKFGSQGQQKSFLVALKLAKYGFMKEVKGYSPILLLDDIFDKLDDGRVKRLMKNVSTDHFGQVFITDTSTERIHAAFDDEPQDVRIFQVKEGNVELLNETVSAA